MSQTDIANVIIWGMVCCFLAIGVGTHRAWKAGRTKLALVPIILLVAGLLIIPFMLGLVGIGAPGVWIGRAFILFGGIAGLLLFFKFEGKSRA
ncbi:hypothetical protein [Rhodanobacter lindaniclasticus]|nr:hypothetical protein [Rhodanobacter lindaniclasticus]